MFRWSPTPSGEKVVGHMDTAMENTETKVVIEKFEAAYQVGAKAVQDFNDLKILLMGSDQGNCLKS